MSKPSNETRVYIVDFAVHCVRALVRADTAAGHADRETEREARALAAYWSGRAFGAVMPKPARR